MKGIGAVLSAILFVSPFAYGQEGGPSPRPVASRVTEPATITAWTQACLMRPAPCLRNRIHLKGYGDQNITIFLETEKDGQGREVLTLDSIRVLREPVWIVAIDPR